MIKCLYCGYECPDNTQICPNCGKPIVRLSPDDTPDYDELAKALLRKNEQKEPRSQKSFITVACVVLLLALVAYTILAR